MRYLLLHCIVETAPLSPAENSDQDGSPAAQAVEAWVSEMESRGVTKEFESSSTLIL